MLYEDGQMNESKHKKVTEQKMQLSINMHRGNLFDASIDNQSQDFNTNRLYWNMISFPLDFEKDPSLYLFKHLINILPEGIILLQELGDECKTAFHNQQSKTLLQLNGKDQSGIDVYAKLMQLLIYNESTIANKSVSQTDTQQKLKSEQKLQKIFTSSSNQLNIIRSENKLYQPRLQEYLKKNTNDHYFYQQSLHAGDHTKYLDINLKIKSIDLQESPHNINFKTLSMRQKKNDLESEDSQNYGQAMLSTFINQLWEKIKSEKQEQDDQLKFEGIYYSKNELFPNQKLDTYSKTQKNSKQQTLEITIFSTLIHKKPTIIVILRDVTHRNMIDFLEKQNKLKSQTLSYVSHEYRTPLNCAIEMLEQAIYINPDQNNFIKCALDNSKYLLNLSNDLLDHAQIRVGKIQIDTTKFNLYLLALECIDMFKLMAKSKQIDLLLSFDSNLSQFIYSDQRRIKQIIINLIGNAFKFTLQGSITLEIKQIMDNNLDISIIDTGIGIRPEDRFKLFKAFGKLQTKESSLLNKQGVGLGLLISNQLAQILSPNNEGLQVESEFKKGSKFWFSVFNHQKGISQSSGFQSQQNLDDPSILIHLMSDQQKLLSEKMKKSLIGCSPKFKESISTFVQSQPLQRNYILIVDDNQFNIDILTLKLNKIDLSLIDNTISGILALEQVRKRLEQYPDEPYKIIFLDLEMPILNGRETAKMLLELYAEYNQEVQIIACSGYSDQNEIELCLNIGFAGYLVKPVKVEDLQSMLRDLYGFP